MQSHARVYMMCLCAVLYGLAGLASPRVMLAAQKKEELDKHAGALVNTRQARLELAIDKQALPDWRITLTLRNLGDVPIVVDRELVFGVTVEVADRDGTRVREESVSTLEAQSIKENRGRLISLPPGKAVSRLITLGKGWRVLQGGEAIDNEGRTIATTGFETIVRVPEHAKPRRVTIGYGAAGQFFWEAFLTLTGINPKEAGFYLGPIEQTIELVE